MIDDPGPLPDDATPEQRRAHARKSERFLTEGGKAGVSKVPAKLDATDARLKALRKDHVRFLEAHSPAKASIWLALLQPAKEVIHAVDQLDKFTEGQQNGTGGGSADMPAIIALGQRAVANGLRGDNSAIAAVFERIEGKAGLRVGDEDPDDPAKRKHAADVAERIIRKLTNGRVTIESKVVDAVVIDVVSDDKVVDNS